MLLALLLACGASERETLNVYAASSLTEAFQELEVAFEAANPSVDAALTFAGSQTLRLQIEQGAPADVFASADPAQLDLLVNAGLVRDAAVFAHNGLVVIVPVDSELRAFAELPRARRLVLGSEHAPVGRYARDVLRRAGADFEAAALSRVVSEESNARLVRAKVALGEADAAFVYRTDAFERVRVVPIPEGLDVRAAYPIGVVVGSGRPALADAWVALVRSPEGRGVLARHGFE